MYILCDAKMEAIDVADLFDIHLDFSLKLMARDQYDWINKLVDAIRSSMNCQQELGKISKDILVAESAEIFAMIITEHFADDYVYSLEYDECDIGNFHVVKRLYDHVVRKQEDQWDETTRGKKMSSSKGDVIFKYQMPVKEHFEMKLPRGAKIIRVADQDGFFWLWAVINTDQPDEIRKFHAVKCGGNMPDVDENKLEYVGCCAMFIQQELMLYIFEEVSK